MTRTAINHRQHRIRPRGGFTLLELIAAIVIMGIVAVAANVSFNSGYHDLERETDLLRSRIRYAQALALGNNFPFGVACTGSQYYLYSGLDTNTARVFPGEEQSPYSLPSGLVATAFVVSFDGWGVPYSNAAQTTQLGVATIITMTSTRGGTTETSSTTVTPITGFVP